MPVRDRLRAEKLRGGETIGRDIIVLQQTESTNEVIRQMSAGDWPEGLCVFAEHQTAGRGQRGNKWESAAGKGLWFSILLRPKIEIKDSPRLTTWAAGIIAGTLRGEFHLPATVQPPNDVWIDDRKIAGVLVEMRAQIDGPHIAVVGIGLNVNHAPSDFSEEVRERATSVAIVRRGRLDRHLLAVALLRNLDRTYAETFARKL
jgi:BirA family transcriptional regulator, biotin operon repressor / biotin---[acetyl-CoA-carboxylase] ligase